MGTFIVILNLKTNFIKTLIALTLSILLLSLYFIINIAFKVTSTVKKLCHCLKYKNNLSFLKLHLFFNVNDRPFEKPLPFCQLNFQARVHVVSITVKWRFYFYFRTKFAWSMTVLNLVVDIVCSCSMLVVSHRRDALQHWHKILRSAFPLHKPNCKLKDRIK